MKKVVAFLASVVTAVMTFCLTVGAESKKAEPNQTPLLDSILQDYGLIILGVTCGVVAIIAIIIAIVSFKRGRRKAIAARAQATAAPVAPADEYNAYDENNYDYDYDNGEYYGEDYDYNAEPAACNDVVAAPAQATDLSAVPTPVARPVAPEKPQVIVRPIVVKDVVTVPAECPKVKAARAAAANKKTDSCTKSKIVAAVAVTALACSIWNKLKK